MKGEGVQDESFELWLEQEAVRWLEVLWGKSAAKGGGQRNLLLSHLLDTAAVAEQIWEHYASPSTRRVLEELAGGSGQGQRFFAWLCGIHDCGKATPAFQGLDAECAQPVWDSGLTWNTFVVGRTPWRHDKAGGKLLRHVLAQAGWGEEHIEWVWPLVAGHHGTFPPKGVQLPRGKLRNLQGKGAEWEAAQQLVVDVFTSSLGYADLASVQPRKLPSRAVQLQLSGLIVMADWIASNERFFPGVDSLAQVGLASARHRARDAWTELGLRGGWGSLNVPEPESFQDRFGHGMRESQAMVVEAAHQTGGPGLMVVEAPMGEGKTKAALAAAEVLAARFGADGVFVGMPTQATSDPMFTQVRKWVEETEPGLESQVALLHGKRRFNTEWQALLESSGENPDDLYGTVDEDAQYGMTGSAEHGCEAAERRAPAEWFLGRMRGLLCPFVVGTIDQLLFAATRTKHVMLRLAGLVGKVVILDEVHAADVYMSQFLREGLRWLGQAGVPVVLLSATLPPAQRRELVSSYMAGAAATGEESDWELPAPQSYPNVTTVWRGQQGSQASVRHTRPWRDAVPVRVCVLDESPARVPETEAEKIPAGDRAVVDLLVQRLAEGGCALVIRNTVDRAQETYGALRARFGDDEVRLLHGRLHTADRADRTEECLDLLGPPGAQRVSPGRRLILVATQLAEQSFDVDADLLVTDLAPIDLLLQRIGRLHRHTIEDRPVAEAEVVITGFARQAGHPPWIQPAIEAIYGRYLLLRTAAVVIAADGASWQIPTQVPELVSRVYDETAALVPQEWCEAEQAAFATWDHKQRARAASAEPFLLTRFGEHGRTTLEGLHVGGERTSLQEEQFQALVRDGEPSVEVVLVCRDEAGYRTLQGRWLGVNGEVASDRLDEVLGATVRLPPKLTAAANEELEPLPGWRDHPWLRYSRALIFDERGATRLAEHTVRYDSAFGLVVTKAPRGR